MTKYKCIKRVTTDGHKTVHEIGETISLSESDAKSLLRQQAVAEIPEPPKEVPKEKVEKPKPESGDKE